LREAKWLILVAVAGYLLLIFATFHRADPGWSHSATGAPIGNGNPVLKDLRLRKAITQAIDTQAIVDRVMDGNAQPGGGVVPAAFAAYHWAPSAADGAKFDLAAANAALDQAGYPKGPGGVRVAPGGAKLELRLAGHASRPFDQRTTEYVKGWLKDAGITAD